VPETIIELDGPTELPKLINKVVLDCPWWLGWAKCPPCACDVFCSIFAMDSVHFLWEKKTCNLFLAQKKGEKTHTDNNNKPHNFITFQQNIKIKMMDC